MEKVVVLRKIVGRKIVTCIKLSGERRIYARDIVFCETIIPDALESGEAHIEDGKTGNKYVAKVVEVGMYGYR